MSASNRNQPCVCGSGRKTKRCCENGIVLRERALQKDNDERERREQSVRDCNLEGCRCKMPPATFPPRTTRGSRLLAVALAASVGIGAIRAPD